MSKLNRRLFMGAAGSIVALSVLGRPALAQAAQIRHFWWGNPERDSRRLAIHGRDVVLGEKALRLVGGEEVAIFPPLH